MRRERLGGAGDHPAHLGRSGRGELRGRTLLGATMSPFVSVAANPQPVWRRGDDCPACWYLDSLLCRSGAVTPTIPMLLAAAVEASRRHILTDHEPEG